MMPFAMIPAAVPWRLVGYATLALALFAFGFWYGFGWSADDHEKAMSAERQKYAALADKVAEQNRAIDNLNFQLNVAQSALDEAEKRARGKNTIIERRIETVTKYAPKDCEDALAHWWGQR